MSNALDERRFLLQRAQPALSGLIDGSLASVTLGGAIIVGISVALGSAAG